MPEDDSPVSRNNRTNHAQNGTRGRGETVGSSVRVGHQVPVVSAGGSRQSLARAVGLPGALPQGLFSDCRAGLHCDVRDLASRTAAELVDGISLRPRSSCYRAPLVHRDRIPMGTHHRVGFTGEFSATRMAGMDATYASGPLAERDRCPARNRVCSGLGPFSSTRCDHCRPERFGPVARAQAAR